MKKYNTESMNSKLIERLKERHLRRIIRDGYGFDDVEFREANNNMD